MRKISGAAMARRNSEEDSVSDAGLTNGWANCCADLPRIAIFLPVFTAAEIQRLAGLAGYVYFRGKVDLTCCEFEDGA